MFRLASIALLVLASTMSAKASCPSALLGTYSGREIEFTELGRVVAGSCSSTSNCSPSVCPEATITITKTLGDCKIITEGDNCSDGAGGDVAIWYDCDLSRTQSNGKTVYECSHERSKLVGSSSNIEGSTDTGITATLKLTASGKNISGTVDLGGNRLTTISAA